MDKATIALVGDYDPTVTAHRAIPKALEMAGTAVGLEIAFSWVETQSIRPGLGRLRDYAGFWAVPASPYKNMEGVLEVIRFARENKRPFLGTCGGYQHAVLEFARNVLGHAGAGNAEVDPETEMPLVSPLTCSLIEVEQQIDFAKGSKLEALFSSDRTTEAFHCSFGINPEYLTLFSGSKLCFTGTDLSGEPRAFELADHPFFVGTAFQPERQALNGLAHKLIETFVGASAQQSAFA